MPATPSDFSIWYQPETTRVIQVLPDRRLRRSVRFRNLNQVDADTETIQAADFFETFQRNPRFDSSRWVTLGSLWLPLTGGSRMQVRERVVRPNPPELYVVTGLSNGGGVRLGQIDGDEIKSVSTFAIGGLTAYRLMCDYARLWTGATEPDPEDNLWPLSGSGPPPKVSPKKRKRKPKTRKAKPTPKSVFARLGEDDFGDF